MENEFILNAAGIQPLTITEMQSWQSPHPDPLFHTNGWDAPAFNPTVSSPAGSNPDYVSNESILIRELMGKLGCFGGNPTEIVGSSCHSTPLSSPLKLENSVAAVVNPDLAEFAADPGFVERAARFSCFGSRSFNGRTDPYIGGGVEFHQGHFRASSAAWEVKLGRVSSSPSLSGLGLGSRPRIAMEVPLGSLDRINSMESPEEESSVIEPVPRIETSPRGSGEMNPRKRKGVANRGKTKEPANVTKVIQGVGNSSENLSAKRYKSNEGDDRNKKEGDREGEDESKQNKMEVKPAEPPKDYIHVRARRGQATDSHSLAERVRREKISERMKLLQDLVPGCNKVTGKALMLDEIINYVQSLQRQVEFLSMKLASVNTSLDVNSDSLLSKDHHHHRHHHIFPSNNTLPHHMFPRNSPSTAATTDVDGHHPHRRPLDSHFTPPSNLQYQGFSSGGDDLLTIVQLGLAGQSSNQDTTTSFQHQRFHY